MKTIQTFIFVHNQQIILEYKSIKKFNNLPNLKFVLVGKNPYDLVDGMDDVIICQKYVNNIEDYPKFTSYTGWYLLWKENLINSDYINLFEYDINIKNNLVSLFDKIVNSSLDFVGYLPMSIQEPCYLKDRVWTESMISSIKKNYQIDMDDFFKKYIKEFPTQVWSSTSNCTFNRQSFTDYMVWFEKIFFDLKDFQYAGHAHERSISFFYLLKKLKVAIFPGFIEHFQLNSHNTSPLPENRFDKLYKNLL